jgi:hypothetical protein
MTAAIFLFQRHEATILDFKMAAKIDLFSPISRGFQNAGGNMFFS